MHAGSVRPIELFSYFNIETGDLEKNLFMVFDEGKTGKLNFLEFAAAMWNFLSLPEKLVGVLVYLMKDPTGTYCIKLHEVRELFEVLHRRKVETSPMLGSLFAEFKTKHPVEITKLDFCAFLNGNSTLSTPIILLQIKLRKQVIGEGFWQRKASAREKDRVQGDAAYVHQLLATVQGVNEESKRRMLDAKAKSKEAQTSDRDKAAIAKRESIFKKAYNLTVPKRPVVKAPPQQSVAAADSDAPISGKGNGRKKTPAHIDPYSPSASDAALDSPVGGTSRPRKKSITSFETAGSSKELQPQTGRRKSAGKIDAPVFESEGSSRPSSKKGGRSKKGF